MPKTGPRRSYIPNLIERSRTERVGGFGCLILSLVITFWPPARALGLGEGLLESKLSAADGGRGDQLGWSVAIDEDLVVVGAVNAMDTGAVYVFDRGEASWIESIVLRPAGNVPNASFGNAVDADGEILVAGAPRDREDGEVVGAVYVFRRVGGNWRAQARLTATDGIAGDRFGEAVSVHGNRLVVGAPGRDQGGQNAGGAYVFVEMDGSWLEEATLSAAEARAGNLFGTAVAAGDGLIVVGAPTDTLLLNAPGSAYVFERGSDSWAQSARLLGLGSQRDLFGLSVAVDARTIVVGAPRVASDLPPRPGGSVHVFEQTDSGWTERATLRSTEAASGDRFGFSVSITGGTIVASSTGLCTIDVFRRAGIAWTPQASLMADEGCQAAFGRAVAAHRDTIAAGTPSDGERGNSAGAAYVFEVSNETVIVGPGIQTVVAGEKAEIYLTFSSPVADVASLRFDTVLPPDLQLEAQGDSVDCRIEEDLADDHVLVATLLSDPDSLRVEVMPTVEPASGLYRDGLIGRCSARAGKNADPGTRPLACNEDAAPARAAGVDGESLSTRCEDGELTILPACNGDCNGSGNVSIDELLIGIRVALDLHSIETCSALDRNRDQTVSVDELVKAVAAALVGCEGDKTQRYGRS